MRRRQAKKHPLIPDPRFNDTDVTYFVNNLMLKGKKSIAFDIFYSAIDKVTDRTGEDGLEQWKTAVDAVTPNVEVRSRRVGGATYQVPVEVRTERRQALAIRWLAAAAAGRNENTMRERLAGELMDASQGRGNAVKKREDTHRMADANKAFSHYRW